MVEVPVRWEDLERSERRLQKRIEELNSKIASDVERIKTLEELVRDLVWQVNDMNAGLHQLRRSRGIM